MNTKSLVRIKEAYSAFLLVQSIPIGLINEYATITIQMAKIRLLLKTNLRHLDGTTHHQNTTKCEMPNVYTDRILLTINKMIFQKNNNLGCIIILGRHSQFSVFCRKKG